MPEAGRQTGGFVSGWQAGRRRPGRRPVGGRQEGGQTAGGPTQKAAHLAGLEVALPGLRVIVNVGVQVDVPIVTPRILGVLLNGGL